MPNQNKNIFPSPPRTPDSPYDSDSMNKRGFEFARKIGLNPELLESKKAIFQQNLFEVNEQIGDKRWEEAGIIPFEPEGYKPFTEEELDRMRHYYGQKLAYESMPEGKEIFGALPPQMHELFDDDGMVENVKTLYQAWSLGVQMDSVKKKLEENLADLYINGIASLDYVTDKGEGGQALFKLMNDYLYKGSTPEQAEEFEGFGKKALERIEYDR